MFYIQCLFCSCFLCTKDNLSSDIIIIGSTCVQILLLYFQIGDVWKSLMLHYPKQFFLSKKKIKWLTILLLRKRGISNIVLGISRAIHLICLLLRDILNFQSGLLRVCQLRVRNPLLQKMWLNCRSQWTPTGKFSRA